MLFQGLAFRTWYTRRKGYTFSGLLDILSDKLRRVPGFPQLDDLYDAGGHPYIFAIGPRMSVKFRDQFGLGPTPETAHVFLDFLRKRRGKQCMPQDIASNWLLALESPQLSDEDRKEYSAKFEPGWYSQLKSAIFWRTAEKNEWVVIRPTLAQGILTIRGDLGLEVNGARAEIPFGRTMRIQIFRSLSFVLSKFPGNSTTGLLVNAIELVKDEPDVEGGTTIEQPLCGACGLVRLLIYHGGDRHDMLVRKTVLNAAEDSRGPYEGFSGDVLDAVNWKRWLDEQSIGGLPPEIGEMIMLWSWENWCMI